ncbi:unnamed protein product [Paramecium pentaurelia]|uniref:Uncharacterized protein n=1 Tax=Paramecium pentaurelia TaxID=43138 RepID=A0A8S1TUQ4_9CILI|nr:unnamed protein product [Paramecium pentaurelia]
MSTILPYLINKTNNILLLRGDVGKAKPSVSDLPDFSYSYGKKINRDGIGMKEITSDWQYGISSHHKKSKTVKLPEDTFVYGLKNKPSTPFGKVIKMNYGNEAADIIENLYRMRSQRISKKQVIQKNRSYSLRLEHNTKQKEEEHKEFKIKRFLEIKSKIYQL